MILTHLCYTIAALILLFSAVKQLSKNFNLKKFLTWLACAGFIVYCILHQEILATVGESVWKVCISILSGIDVKNI